MRVARTGVGLVIVFVACGGSSDNPGAPLDTGVDSTVPLDGGGDAIADGSDSTTCGAGTIACDGRCVVAASCAFAVTSIDPPGGWLDGGDWVTLHGAGFAKGMKVQIGDGVAPTLVIDDKTTRIQTPPGLVGPIDVAITLGTQTAKLPLGFVYHSNGLLTPWAQKPMAKVRGEWPAVAVLQDRRVLVAGGASTPDDATTSLDTADLYTRSTDAVVAAAGKMASARWRGAAVTLLDGTVLVVGGACTTCTGADLFDPTKDLFSSTKPLAVPRIDPRAVLLVDGRAFVMSSNDGSIELFDPSTSSFTKIDHSQIYDEGFAVRLKDGRVLFGGGGNGTSLTRVETFDAETGTFADVPPLPRHHFWPTAHVVPDGRVFVVGGNSGGTGAWTPMKEIEIFDPKTNTWSTAPYTLTIGRYGHGSTVVRDGTIVVVGGYTVAGDCNSLVDTVDQIDPIKGVVTAFAKLPNKNTELSAVTLLDGSILVVGGGACGASTALPDIDFLPGAPGPG